MDNNELKALARKVIAINVLRKEVSTVTSNSKDAYIDYLLSNNKKRLVWLINYYNATKTKNAFFLHTSEPLDLDALNGKGIKDNVNDVILDFKKVDKENEELIVQIGAHSAIVQYNGVEDPEKLTPLNVRFRKPFSIHFVYHGKDSILECHTRSLQKFNILKAALESHFGCETAPIIITDKECSKIDTERRYKLLTASGLNMAGANKIIIEGDDVEQTVKFFDSKKIKLIDYCEDSKDFVYDRAVTEKKSLRFSKNGKITYRKGVGDVYQELREVLLNHVQAIDE